MHKMEFHSYQAAKWFWANYEKPFCVPQERTRVYQSVPSESAKCTKFQSWYKRDGWRDKQVLSDKFGAFRRQLMTKHNFLASTVTDLSAYDGRLLILIKGQNSSKKRQHSWYSHVCAARDLLTLFKQSPTFFFLLAFFSWFLVLAHLDSGSDFLFQSISRFPCIGTEVHHGWMFN